MNTTIKQFGKQIKSTRTQRGTVSSCHTIMSFVGGWFVPKRFDK